MLQPSQERILSPWSNERLVKIALLITDLTGGFQRPAGIYRALRCASAAETTPNAPNPCWRKPGPGPFMDPWAWLAQG